MLSLLLLLLALDMLCRYVVFEVVVVVVGVAVVIDVVDSYGIGVSDAVVVGGGDAVSFQVVLEVFVAVIVDGVVIVVVIVVVAGDTVSY